MLTITHQLADSLRGLRRTKTAITYYKEVIKHVQNLRTEVDIGKTYCVAGQWGEAQKFLESEVIRREEGKWDGDAHLLFGVGLCRLGSADGQIDSLSKSK